MMWGSRVRLGVVVGLLAAATFRVAAQDAGPQMFTLRECIDRALRESTDIRQADLDYEKSRLSYAQTRAKSSPSLAGSASLSHSDLFWDSVQQNDSLLGDNSASAGLSLDAASTKVDLTVSHALQEADPPLQPDISNSTRASLSVRQTIWDGVLGGKTRLTLEQARLSHQSDGLTLESERRDLEFRVTQAYYSLLSAQRAVELKAQTLEKRTAELERTMLLLEAERATQIDQRQADINLRSAELDLKTAEYDLESSRMKLAQLIGLAPATELQVAETEEIEVPELDLQKALLAALESRIDVKKQRLSKSSADISLALKRTQSSPQISGNASVNFTNNWTRDSRSSSWSAGLQVSIPIYDSGLTAREVESLVVQNQLLDLQAAALQASIRSEIADQIAAVRQAQMKLELAELSLEQAKLNWDLAQTKELAGTGSALDTMSAAVNLSSARSSLLKARGDLQLAILSYRRVLGL